MSKPVDLLLPEDQEAERAVLGSILIDQEQFGKLSAALTADDFAAESNRRIWRIMSEIWQVGGRIDSITITGKLSDAGLIASVPMSYVVGLDVGLRGVSFDCEQYARRVKDTSLRRRIIYAAEKLKLEAQSSDSADVLARGEAVLRDLAAETSRESRLVGAADIINECGGIDGFVHGTQASVSLPWESANHYLAGGFRDGELIIVAARTSVGKTAFATQLANHAGSHGIGTAVFSLEMQRRDMLMRFAICRSGVDGNIVRTNRMSRAERDQYTTALIEATQMPVWFDDSSSSTVPGIHAAVRERMARDKVGLIVVDYLQLVDAVGRHNSRVEAVGSISRGLKRMASEFSVPVVALAQLNRGAEERAQPELTDLRESGSIEQDANTVMMLHRTDKGLQYQDVIPVDLLINKQRNGPKAVVSLLYHAKELTFREQERAEYAA